MALFYYFVLSDALIYVKFINYLYLTTWINECINLKILCFGGFMRLRVAVLAFVLVMVTVSAAAAFNGQRKGFILGGGFGFGSTSYTQTLKMNGESMTSDRENKGAFNSDFRIGYAPSDQLAIYYGSKVAWFGFTNAYDDDVTVSSGVSSLSFSYYLNTTAPSAYFNGGIGLSSWALPFEDDAPDPWNGFGLLGGVGYEFSRHLSAEFNLVYGNPGTNESGLKIHADVISVMVTINAIAY
jgi:hypothetical protein